MNGARSIFLRKGYWLTALAAIVLLAASPGTASAQITVTGPDKNTVTEGETAVYTVDVKGFVPVNGQAGQQLTVTLALQLPTAVDGTDGEVEDYSTNLGLRYSVDVPAGQVGDGAVAIAFNRSGTIRIPTTQDADAENEKFTLEFTASVAGVDADAAGAADIALAAADYPTALTIDDDETQTYVFDVTTKDPKEGDVVAVNLRADPAHADVSASIVLTLHSSDAKYTLSAATVMLTAETVQAGEGFTIITPGEDGNRVEDSVTVKAFTGTLGRPVERASETIKVADINALPAVAMMVLDEDGEVADPQPTSVAEGTSIMVAVMPLDKDGDADDAKEDLTVALTPTGTADSADYTLVGTFTIDDGDDTSNAVEIEVRSDEDVGMESLMFDAVVTGDSDNGAGTLTSAGVLSLYIEDATAKKITPKASEADYAALMAAIAVGGGDDGVNPGDTVTVMTSDLFEVEPGYTASYGVSVEGDSASASASGESVTINALMAGEAKVTVTGTARMASSSLIPTQTVSNVAELTFPVMVVDTELVVTLSAEPMEIVAGGTTMITATANRAVTVGDGAVEIALAVVPEGNGTLDPESIMIAMGEMSGSAMLTANESVTVVASGSGVTGLMQVAVTVTAAPEPEPEPVPALPLIAQWLLGLGLMGGGVRQLFRRRRQG